MKTQLTPLELLTNFFQENSKEETNKLLNEFDKQSFNGPLVHEYFENLDLEFETFHNELFTSEYLEGGKISFDCLLDTIGSDLILETIKGRSIINSKESETFTEKKSNYALAA